jgi:hypothetical protein
MAWKNSQASREKHWNWKGGVDIYREILKESGVVRKCLLCGIENEKVLVAHHKDHNRNNNHKSNLLWLCMNCHHLVHHDRKLDSRIRNQV